MQMTADGRVVGAELREREAARQAYHETVASGRRASIAEEERPDVFTIRLGNILPGERVSVALTSSTPGLRGWRGDVPLPACGAPRYIPAALVRISRSATDTPTTRTRSRRIAHHPARAVARISHPVALAIDVGIDPAGLTLSEVRSSLHAVSYEDGRIRIQPGSGPTEISCCGCPTELTMSPTRSCWFRCRRRRGDLSAHRAAAGVKCAPRLGTWCCCWTAPAAWPAGRWWPPGGRGAHRRHAHRR